MAAGLVSLTRGGVLTQLPMLVCELGGYDHFEENLGVFFSSNGLGVLVFGALFSVIASFSHFFGLVFVILGILSLVSSLTAFVSV